MTRTAKTHEEEVPHFTVTLAEETHWKILSTTWRRPKKGWCHHNMRYRMNKHASLISATKRCTILAISLVSKCRLLLLLRIPTQRQHSTVFSSICRVSKLLSPDQVFCFLPHFFLLAHLPYQKNRVDDVDLLGACFRDERCYNSGFNYNGDCSTDERKKRKNKR